MLLTMKDLIQYFADKVRQIDLTDRNYECRREPEYPMAVVYLGEESAKAHNILAEELYHIWPPYKDKLLFLGIREAEGGQEFFYVSEDGNTTVTNDTVVSSVEGLFSTEMHFHDRTSLLIYFLLDTGECSDKDEFLKFLTFMEYAKKVIPGERQTDMLTILLNEGFTHIDTAKQIRNSLSDMMRNENAVLDRSVFLISNKRSDLSIDSNWKTGYQIMSKLIVLSNNRDKAAQMSNPSVKTVGYSRAEKPLNDIGQIVLSVLFDELAEAADTDDNFDMEQVWQRLGLSERNTFSILDEYAEDKLIPALPLESQLKLFPRISESEWGNLSYLSAAEFDAATMGAWNCFLSQLIEKTRNEILQNAAFKTGIKEKFKKQLLENFKNREIIFLGEKLCKYEDLPVIAEIDNNETILKSAENQLKYMLSSAHDLQELFLSAVKEQAEAARNLQRIWKKIQDSRLNLHHVADESIIRYYRDRKMKDYIDRQKIKLITEFERLQDEEQLETFLKKVIEDVIESDQVYRTSFEEEMQNRLSGSVEQADMGETVRRKLTSSQYLTINFNFGTPIIRSVFLNMQTDLYSMLRTAMEDGMTMYYYDTGIGSMAETLEIYELSAENLISS